MRHHSLHLLPRYGYANCNTTNSTDELAKALKDFPRNHRELATSMLDAINEVCSIEEQAFQQPCTPELVASFLNRSNKAKEALRGMISARDMNWVKFWLHTTLQPAPPFPVLIQDTMRHDVQPRSCLKQQKKNPVSPGEGPKSSYVKLVCTEEKAIDIEEKATDIEEKCTGIEEKFTEIKEKAIDVDQNVQRSVTCLDVSALKAPKRRFNEKLDLSDISNFGSGRRLKAPRLSLADKKQNSVLQKQMPESIPFSGPPLASQPAPAKYPVKPTIPGCSIKWASNLEQILANSVMLILKSCPLHTMDRLPALYGRNILKQGSLINGMCLTSRLSRRPERRRHRSYRLWHHRLTLTISCLFISPPN